VTCGQINCGRYVKAHGLAHFQKTSKQQQHPHPVCLEANELSVFCYACDDFIVNDTNDTKLDRMRGVITKHQESTSNSASQDEEVRTVSDESTPVSSRERRAVRRRTFSTGSSAPSAGKGEENDQPTNKRARRGGGSNGVNEKSAEQKQRLKQLVGLRNLGNTCFMSAVLQSLGNIQEFCSVLKQLPSLEDQLLRKTGKRDSHTGKGGKNGIIDSTKTSQSASKGSGDSEPIMTEELRKVLVALSSNSHHNPPEHTTNLNKSLGSAISPTVPSTSQRKVISPESLFHVIWKVVPRFRGYQQQDAHEFLRYMLDRLHTELLTLIPDDDLIRDHPHLKTYFRQLRKHPMLTYSRSSLSGSVTSSPSLVTHMFGGTLQSEVTCLVCNASSKKHDPFLDLSIDIPSALSIQRKAREQQEPGANADYQNLRIYDCLEKFVEVEELSDSERFFCNNCKNKQRSTKKFWIRRLPNVLCLHLKRFRWSPYSRTKLDNHIEFPLHGLDMSPFLLSNLHETRCSNSGSSLYDLAAVIVHHGSGAGSGHYTAFVVKDNHWFHFNDSTVLATDHETVTKSKAYILFYIQRELKKPSS